MQPSGGHTLLFAFFSFSTLRSIESFNHTCCFSLFFSNSTKEIWIQKRTKTSKNTCRNRRPKKLQKGHVAWAQEEAHHRTSVFAFCSTKIQSLLYPHPSLPGLILDLVVPLLGIALEVAETTKTKGLVFVPIVVQSLQASADQSKCLPNQVSQAKASQRQRQAAPGPRFG